MKTKRPYVLVVLLLILGVAYAQQDSNRKKVILLDPGHGGIDSGTTAEDGTTKKDVVLDVAMNMVKLNQDILDSKYEIYLTRVGDTLIDLEDRSRLVQYLRPDLFISLHCNHSPSPKTNGVEAYVHGNNKKVIGLAESIIHNLNQNLGLRYGSVKTGNFHVLRKGSEYCPSILLELGYLSNLDESHYLEHQGNRKALALAILESFKRMKDSL
ncbi:N-acetylmuramoyl-L-alanine amidase family protein [Maribacter sp. 2307UL18-2]|uniref:N-acetylmuramoyl-L-alanine amidase family protein n=1 Tax=Maribacter sp. 2307UL18-2 TaxID=3386274 RepID=UPI0039BC8718